MINVTPSALERGASLHHVQQENNIVDYGWRGHNSPTPTPSHKPSASCSFQSPPTLPTAASRPPARDPPTFSRSHGNTSPSSSAVTGGGCGQATEHSARVTHAIFGRKRNPPVKEQRGTIFFAFF